LGLGAESAERWAVETVLGSATEWGLGLAPSSGRKRVPGLGLALVEELALMLGRALALQSALPSVQVLAQESADEMGENLDVR